jgi:hypothetical protein
MVRIGNYGQYDSGNYGAHTIYIDVGSFTFYFSYQTCVAFNSPGMGLVVSENIWSTTTGKHLNWIQEDKKRRIKNDEFEAMLKLIEAQIGGIPVVV